MGGVDDNEPPSKRTKVSSTNLRSISNNLTFLPTANHPRISMDKQLSSNGKDEDTIGTRGLIRKVEYVRIIAQTLYSLGYEKAAAVLEEESGVNLQSPIANIFKKHVLDGNWDESVINLKRIGVSDENIVKSASFLILEYKFFEFLHSNRISDALKTLRSEIAPLGIKKERLHELSSCMVNPSQGILLGFANLDIDKPVSKIKLLDKLQKIIPPSILIPESRLEHLVEQALDVQREACYFHNSLDSLSLYTDHQCGKDQIPSKTTQVLQSHQDEVWCLQFSNNGKYLASSSNDKSAIIWEVHVDGKLTLKHRLCGHQKPVLMVSWSPNDQDLLTCGMEESVRRWDVISGKCLHVYEKGSIGFMSCGWFPEGKILFTGVTDKTICLWDLHGKEVESWKGQRAIKTSDMAITKDGRKVVSLFKEYSVLVHDRETKQEHMIEEEHIITSFSLSMDDGFLLINLVNQEIHLWSINDDPELVMTFKGHKRSRFVIRSCFGGFGQSFIASGSEDSKVYIWHRATGDLIEALSGHSGAVNCVSWNPANLHMLASASDDGTIRIWGVNRNQKLKRKEAAYSNGYALQCNGNGKMLEPENNVN